jgi:hypothetical protein
MKLLSLHFKRETAAQVPALTFASGVSVTLGLMTAPVTQMSRPLWLQRRAEFEKTPAS